jgi:hypothetical protein
MNSCEPSTARESEIMLFLSALRSVIPAQSGVYVSAPLTSGRRFAEWSVSADSSLGASSTQYQLAHSDHVVRPNRAAAANAISQLRRDPPDWLSQGASPLVVIDPTAVPDLDRWGQDDYRVLWKRVIEEFARAIVFLDGWNYSSGCAYEFLTGVRRGLDLRRVDGSNITAPEGIGLLSSGAKDLEGLGADTVFLRWVAEEVELGAVRRPAFREAGS